MRPAAAQSDSAYRLERVQTGTFTDAALDHLGHLYLVTPSGQVKKYGQAGDSLSAFNGVRRFGPLHTVDVSNPLRPLLFYRDFATIVLLDRQLAQRTSIDLRKSGIVRASAAAPSYDNNIWVFDELENKLKKIDESGKVLLSTPDFRQVFGADEQVVPQFITDRNGKVHLGDPASGIYVFDVYGTFQRKYPLKGWTSMSLEEERIVVMEREGLSYYLPATLQLVRSPLPSFFKPYFYTLSGPGSVILRNASEVRVLKVVN